MPRMEKKRLTRRRVNAAERLFVAAFGRKMTARERARFIVEKPFTLAEIGARRSYEDAYDFLRQT